VTSERLHSPAESPAQSRLDPRALRDGRWLRLDGAVNVRDLGGLPTGDGRRTRSGVLYRADNLQDLTEADVAGLVEALGVRTVVDLRTSGEVRLEGPGPLHAAGLAHEHHSLVPDEQLRAAELDDRVLPDRRYTSAVDVYLGYLDEAPDAVVAAVRILADPAAGPTVFHCAAGKDRTGVLAALVEAAVGVTPDAVLDDYLDTVERVPAIVGRLLASATYAEDVGKVPLDHHTPRAETMQGVLSALDEQWGGARGWLLAHGLTEAELDALAERLVEAS